MEIMSNFAKKMNVLFVTIGDVNPLANGISRVTESLVNSFSSFGWKSYGACFKTAVDSQDLFVEKIGLDFSNEAVVRLRGFIQRRNISRVIVQEVFPVERLIVVRKAVKDCEGCTLFYCIHFNPGKEFVRPSLKAEWWRFLYGERRANALKKTLIAMLPKILYQSIVRKYVRKIYSSIYDNSDYVVLLSASYIPAFMHLMGRDAVRGSRCLSVWNSLSFPESVQFQLKFPKKEEVLIVSRMAERQKRLSVALKVWSSIEKSGRFSGWKLRVVGTGPDENYYHRVARKLKLERVSFEGAQNPIPYYRDAALFMMTSAYEGWGMTIVESLQMGVVPIAFATYSALCDIVKDGETGIVVQEGDILGYTRQMMRLMESPEERERMSRNAMGDCRRFAIDNIAAMWRRCLEDSVSSKSK